MSQPRIFVSSTCYDLSQIREDLRAFIISLGYEARLSEHNDVAYNTTSSLETDCYAEIGLCDIVIGIIGGKFGSESSSENKSVSMGEMDTAIDKNKQIYVFILNNVYTEFNTYLANKDKTINYVSVNDVRIFEYIESLRSKSNIVINSFMTAKDITQALRSQWAGLFQNFLSNRERLYDDFQAHKMYQIAERLEKTKAQYEAILKEYQSCVPTAAFTKSFINPVYTEFRDVLLSPTHPIILFKNYDEMVNILKSLGYNEEPFETDNEIGTEYISYSDDGVQSKFYVRKKLVFDEIGETLHVENKRIQMFKEKKTPLFRYTHIDPNGFNGVDDDDLPF